ncbi:MFS transporter [Kitasatospora sp. NBC_01266]|uniref:MFS transporter n=1 Tax=Kitasatospora sp. NBC_01266 TaxID=2903572 RepID=UPI002E31E3C8|nr:MFS transporter [Kitasatospora sp. NBC_01266]
MADADTLSPAPAPAPAPASGSAPADEAVPAASLRRDRRFLRFWTGQSISQFGDRISELALPLIAVGALRVSAAQVSLLTALIWAPNLLAIFFGAWVDHQRRKRRLMVIADLVRAATLSTLPIACWAGKVTLSQLYLVAVVTGAAAVLFNSAYSPFFAHLVPRSAYLEANSKLSTSRSASYIAGPAIGGALVQALTAPVAVLVDAFSFLGSALLVGRIPLDEPRLPVAQQAELSMLTRARQGLAFVVRHPVLRASLGCCSTVNFFTFMANALIVLFASRGLGLSAGSIGLAFGVGAIGGLLGAMLAPRLGRRLGIGRTVALGAVLFPAPLAIMAMAGGPLWSRAGALAVTEFLSSLGVMLFDVNLNSLQAAVIPDGMRSRVSGAFSTVNYGIRPVGALVGGLLGTVLGLRETLLLAALGGSLSLLWLLASPIPRIRSLESIAATGAAAGPIPQQAP